MMIINFTKIKKEIANKKISRIVSNHLGGSTVLASYTTPCSLTISPRRHAVNLL